MDISGKGNVFNCFKSPFEAAYYISDATMPASRPRSSKAAVPPTQYAPDAVATHKHSNDSALFVDLFHLSLQSVISFYIQFMAGSQRSIHIRNEPQIFPASYHQNDQIVS